MNTTNEDTQETASTDEVVRNPIEQKPTLMLVDGYALIYRAYHALPATLSSPVTHEPTNAIMGFTTMLLDTLRKQKPDYVAIALDRGKTFRHEEYAEYKATRAAMPDDLRQQIGRVREIIEALKMPIFEAEGFEADDVIGTLAQQAEQQGIRTLIVTGDLDELQLVTDMTDVLTPTGRNRFDETKLYDPDAVQERYGFGPLHIPDYKSLIGDKSDNIPGVNGIGEKGATALINQFGTLEEMIEHVDEIKPPKYSAALKAGADQARKSKHLATIVRDVPITLNLNECHTGSFDRERIVDIFRELGFRRLVDKLPGAQAVAQAAPAKKAPAGQMSMFDSEEAAAEAPESADGASETVMPPGYEVVATTEQLEKLAERLKNVERVVFDVETTSKEEMQGDLVGISLSPEPGEAYYVAVGHTAGQQVPLADAQKLLAPIMAADTPVKDAHNAKYDMIMMARNGMPLGENSLGNDTMIIAYLLGEQSKGLKELAFQHLNVQMTPITALIGTGRNQITMDQVEIDKAAAYAGADADMTYRLQEILAPQLRDEPELWMLYKEIEMPLVPVLAAMELAGVYVNTTVLNDMSTELYKKMRELEQQIHDFAGHEFNINSSQQLGAVLFEELGLQSRQRTKTGYSTAQEVLDNIRSQHPIVDMVSEWRSLNKLKSTYLDALPLMVNRETGRVHTSFNQTVASTGRLSSANPNLQNIPVRTEVGRLVRRAFEADNTSKKPLVSRPSILFAADYSQIELRILAHMTGEETLTNAFLSGGDVHAATAAELFEVPLAEVKPEMRYLAKRINFGVLYGMGTYGLTRDTELSMAQAHEFIDRYWARLPKIRQFMDQTLQEARRTGFVTTLLGRRRLMPELKSSNIGVRQAAERAAINAPVQGTAADIIKIAMIRVQKELQQRNLEAKMLLQVHDELLFELPESELAVVEPMVREIMEGAFPMNVPLRVEVKHGRSWGEME